METLFVPAFNFAIFVGALALLLPSRVREFVVSRHDFIRDEVHRVQEQLREARSRYEEFSAKLKAIDAEVQALRDQTRLDGETMKARILNDAKRLSDQIVTDANASASALVNDVRGQLRIEMANRIVERAETILRQRLTSDDRVRIRKDFPGQVEGSR